MSLNLMSVFIAVANQRDGVGKTTTAVTLGRVLAVSGPFVLLIDLDPKGQVADALELDTSSALYRWLVEGVSLSQVTITNVRPRLRVVLGDRQTATIKRGVTNLDLTERISNKVLPVEFLGNGVVIFDLGTSLDDLQQAALQVSDWIIIPSKLDALAVTAVHKTLSSIVNVPQANHLLSQYSILPTFFDPNNQETQTRLKDLMETFPGKVLPPIPMDTTIKETTTSVPTDFGNNPISPALEGYYNADGRKIGGYRVIANHFVNLIDNMEIEKAKNLRLDR